MKPGKKRTGTHNTNNKIAEATAAAINIYYTCTHVYNTSSKQTWLNVYRLLQAQMNEREGERGDAIRNIKIYDQKIV